MNDKTIIFYDEPSFPNYWYNNLNKLYKKILEKHNFNIVTKRLLNGSAWAQNNLDVTLKYEIENVNPNALYVLNPIQFATFIANIKRTVVRNRLYIFLKSIKYIILWQEVLLDDLRITGYGDQMYDKHFTIYFFSMAKHIISSNYVTIESLKKYRVTNYSYNIITGYSEINNIIPLANSNNKEIDILIYGTIRDKYTYRADLIKKIKQNSKYNIQIMDGVYDTKLDIILNKTKLVIHIPSYPNLKHMPWPKITYLQAKKVLFMIEENAEMYDRALDKIIPHFKQDDINDLNNKIDYYLSNPDKINDIIEANYNFIINERNMDNDINKEFTSYLV